MENRPVISIVICTYNRADMLRRALNSLSSQHCNDSLTYEIIVVDDGSTDSTEQVVREARRCTDRPVCYLRENGVGVAAARNSAVRAARGEWLAFTDDDQIAEPNWLSHLMHAQSQTGADAVGGARVLELSADVLNRLPKQIRLVLGEIDPAGAIHICNRDALVCTGNLLIRKDVVEVLGGFDAALVQGGEDTDLFMRLRRAGKSCWFTPYAVVRHIIPKYRLQSEYLLWASLRGGACYAHRDAREWGLGKTWLVCAIRVAHATAKHFPGYFVARLLTREADALSRRCALWRTWGYATRVLQMSVPRMPRVAECSSGIEFRNERNLFHNT